MKKIGSFVLIIFTLITALNCSKEKDIPVDLEVQNFIWKGLNLYYFWQSEITDLQDDRFSSQPQLNTYLESYDGPVDLFEGLLFDRLNTDIWSWIVDDYITLEEQLLGISENHGVEFGLKFISENNTELYGYVRYILPNSDATSKNISRGDIFLEVNGTQLTVDNYQSLLFSDNNSYTLNMADYVNGIPVLNGVTVNLIKSEYQENPVYITNTIDANGVKIGYIMYNGFTSSFNNELNDAMLDLKNQGINELIVDLRYNSGGSIQTATEFASMITGQFNGELFTKEDWNDKWQPYFEESFPEFLVNNFVNTLNDGASINSLNLSTLYVITTGSSASASELLINGLKAYIDVKIIGEKTAGKYVGSITLYDSDNFRKENVNPNHTWAMQPIVLQVFNKLGQNDMDGFDPDVSIGEDSGNLAVLGDPNEPLLARAIQFITTGSKMPVDGKEPVYDIDFTNSQEQRLSGNNMYIQKKLPF